MTGSRLMAPVLECLALLTVLPVGRRPQGLPTGQAALAFPIAGGVVGGVLLGVDQLLGLVLPDAPRAALTVAAWAAVTGALHLDGLADSADGLLVPGDRARRLGAMADPRLGAFGAVAVTALLLLKWSSLLPLEGRLRMGALLFSPTMARTAVLLPMAFLPAARSVGMGAATTRGLGRAVALAANLALAALALVAFFPAGPALSLAAAAACLGVGLLALRRLGGTTGDVLGAGIELAEAAVLALCATSAGRGWLS